VADAFDETVGKLAKLGVTQIPILGLVAEAFREFLPPGADERLRQAINEDAERQLEDLQRRVCIIEEQLHADGQTLDEIGPIRTVTLARTVIASVRDEYVGDVKREAVNNATARQFDPRFGSQEARKYWLDVVLALTDVEIKVVQLLRQHGELKSDLDGKLYFKEKQSVLPDADQISLGATVIQMGLNSRKDPALVQPTTSGAFKLTAPGYMLSGFTSPIQPQTGAEPESPSGVAES
jgi:hypothetical protein